MYVCMYFFILFISCPITTVILHAYFPYLFYIHTKLSYYIMPSLLHILCHAVVYLGEFRVNQFVKWNYVCMYVCI